VKTILRAAIAAAFAITGLAAATIQPAAARTQGGYWMMTADGQVHSFGGAADLGSPWSIDGRVKITPTPSGEGYWVLSRVGSIYNYGDAKTFGSVPSLFGEEQYTTMAATPTGKGYWLFTNKGRVVRFGDANFYGDMSSVVLKGQVLDAVATPTGHGYYMVGSDGGVFTFGDAAFHGSTGKMLLNKPVMSLAPDPDGAGYWLVASDGGIFGFDAPFYGSAGGLNLNKPISGMVASPSGGGYLMVAQDGGIFSFGDVPFYGSLGGNPPAFPVVSVAAIGNPPPAPVTAWQTVTSMSYKGNTTSETFHLEAGSPVRMTYSCTTPTGEGSGCLVEVNDYTSGTHIDAGWAMPNPGESGNVLLYPEKSGLYVIHGEIFDWRQLTTWQVKLEQEICVSNCQFYGQ
jgi:hypothetical protein